MVVASKKKRGPIWSEPPFLVGLLITLFVFGVAIWSLTAGEVCDALEQCISKWEALKLSPPNEIGDALAGFAGTLAFVWLIVTVWLQATELREQREEFEKMANAQQEQVILLVKQGEIFEQEQRERQELRAKYLVDELVKSVFSELREVQKVLRSGSDEDIIEWFQLIEVVTDEREMFYSVFEVISGYNEFLQEKSQKPSMEALYLIEVLESIGETAHEIVEMLSQLSESQCQRVKNLQLRRLSLATARLMKRMEEYRNPLQDA